jgi:hypothetical protein
MSSPYGSTDLIWSGKPFLFESISNPSQLSQQQLYLSISQSTAELRPYNPTLPSHSSDQLHLYLLFADSPKKKDVLRYGDIVVLYNLTNNNSLAADPDSLQLYPTNIYTSKHITAWTIAGNKQYGEPLSICDKITFLSSTENSMCLVANSPQILSVADLPSQYNNNSHQQHHLSCEWYIKPIIETGISIQAATTSTSSSSSSSSTLPNSSTTSSTIYDHNTSHQPRGPSPLQAPTYAPPPKPTPQVHLSQHNTSNNNKQQQQSPYISPSPYQNDSTSSNSSNNPSTTISPAIASNSTANSSNNSLTTTSPFIQQSKAPKKAILTTPFEPSTTTTSLQKHSNPNQHSQHQHPTTTNLNHTQHLPNHQNETLFHTPGGPSNNSNHDQSSQQHHNHNYNNQHPNPTNQNNQQYPHHQSNKSSIAHPERPSSVVISPDIPHSHHYHHQQQQQQQQNQQHNQTQNFPFSPIPNHPQHNQLFSPHNQQQQLQQHNQQQHNNNTKNNTNNNNNNNNQYQSEQSFLSNQQLPQNTTFNQTNSNLSNITANPNVTTLTTHQIQQMTPFIELKLCESILHAFYGVKTELIDSSTEYIDPVEIVGFFNQHIPTFTQMSTDKVEWTFFSLDETMSVQINNQHQQNQNNQTSLIDLPMSMTNSSSLFGHNQFQNNNSFQHNNNSSLSSTTTHSPQTAIINIPMGFRNMISSILPICSAYVFISKEIKIRNTVTKYGYCSQSLSSILSDLLKNIEAMIANLETVLKAGYMGHISGIQVTEALDRQLIEHSQFGFLNLNFPFYNQGNNNNHNNGLSNHHSNQQSMPGQQPLQLTVMKLAKYIRTQIEPILTSIVLMLITLPTKLSYDEILQELYRTSRNSYTKHHQLIHQHGVGLTTQVSSQSPVVTLHETEDTAIGYYIIYPRHEMFSHITVPLSPDQQQNQQQNQFTNSQTSFSTFLLSPTLHYDPTSSSQQNQQSQTQFTQPLFPDPYTNTSRLLKGGVLLNHIYIHYFCSNDELCKQVLLSILQYVSIPYFSLLLHWLKNGEISRYDVYNELFLYTNPSITTTYLLSQPQFFISQYLYVDHTNIPVWLVPYIDLIVQCGKYHILFKEFWHFQQLYYSSRSLQFSSNMFQQQQQTQLLYLFSLLSHNGTGHTGISGFSTKNIYTFLLGNSNINLDSITNNNTNSSQQRHLNFNTNSASTMTLGQHNVKHNPILMAFAQQLQQQDQLYNGFISSNSPSHLNPTNDGLNNIPNTNSIIDSNGNTTLLLQQNGRRVNLLSQPTTSSSTTLNNQPNPSQVSSQTSLLGHNSVSVLTPPATLNDGKEPLDEI